MAKRWQKMIQMNGRGQCFTLMEGRQGQKCLNSTLEISLCHHALFVSFERDSFVCVDISFHHVPAVRVKNHSFTMLPIQYSRTPSSFSFSLSENPTSNSALFVNKSAVKWSEQRTKFLLMWHWKIKFIQLFPNVGIRRKAMQRQHCTASCCLQRYLYRLVST